MNPIYRFTVVALRLYIRLTCRIDAPDLHKFPMKGPLIAIANHTGQIEVPIFFALLQPRKMTGWAKIETWDNWFLNYIFNLWGAIPVRRGMADTAAIHKAVDALEKGYIFGIAPEGTRSRTGRLLRAHPGAVMVATHTNVPILPVAHWGGENFLHNLKRLKRTDFHIRVGESFRLKTEGVKMTREVRQQIADEMMYRIAALLPAEYRGKYADLESWTPRYTELVPRD